MIDDRNFENDFASDEYVRNNIRVRPVSSASKFEDGSTSMHDRNSHYDSDYDEQKYNRDTKNDLDNIRERVRQMYLDYVERRERQLALEAANKEGKRK